MAASLPPRAGSDGGRSLLLLEDVHSGYGKREVIRGVSLHVGPGEIVALIGPNGAGKSTLLKTIFGYLRPSAGEVLLDGESLRGLSPPEVLRRGVAYVLQGYAVLPNLTVEDNLELGAYIRRDTRIKEDIERVMDLFPILRERRRQKARVLSGGERRMLEIARVLLIEPRLILLDEPTLGMAPKVIEFIYEKIREVNHRGTAILIVEQNAKTALRHANRAYVLENGTVRYTGSGEAMLRHPEVRRAYLGG